MVLAPLKKLRRREPKPEDLVRSYREIRRQKNGRGAALLACALLDRCLSLAIYSALPNKSQAENLLEDHGLLGTFSAKISLGHALGLFGNQTRRNLDIIREMRNLFAHDTTQLSFSTPEITQACRELVLPTPHPMLPKNLIRSETPRDHYVSTTIVIGGSLFMNCFGSLYEGEPGEVQAVVLP
jgi:hypothetical protein